MTNRPRVRSLDELRPPQLTGAVLVSLPRFAETCRERLDLPRVEAFDDVPADARALVVVGGGTLIDEAKLWRRHRRPALQLVAIPTVWGSGAEASPIVAVNRDGKKHIEVDEALCPDARAVWPELAKELPEWRARAACGDAWSHAIEGFLSPLASDELRVEGAELLRHLLTLPLGNDPAWFEASARACALQARSSVGLVHGLAHTLEGPLTGVHAARPFGHARLCALFLAPVLALNRETSSQLDELAGRHGLGADELLCVARELFDAEDFDLAAPALEEHWPTVLRDPCTRTNSALVRPAHKDFFLERRFL